MATGSAGTCWYAVSVITRKDDCRPTRLMTGDNSYRDSLGEKSWRRLAPEVRMRFSHKPRPGQSLLYRGVMHRVELSFMGWLFAQACRVIGTPLAPYRGTDVPMIIELSQDANLGGIAWHRTYEFPGGRMFTARSTKCNAAGSEFIEHIGCGFQMRLRLTEEDGNLVFISTQYEVCLFGRNCRIPPWLTPGKTTVRHEQLTGDRFRFSLSVDHPQLGRTVFQVGEFYSDVSDV